MYFSRTSVSRSNSNNLSFTNVSAVEDDSFIISPNRPVSISSPLPFKNLVSMIKISPPAAVQARPVLTPTSLLLNTCDLLNLAIPRNLRTCSCFMTKCLSLSSVFPDSTKWRAIFLMTMAICRSRFRTPASRVYSFAIFKIVESSIAICE